MPELNLSKMIRPRENELLRPKLENGDKRAYGTRYEEIAEKYLTDLGYRLIAKNVNFKFGEIDLIFEHEGSQGKELVFVEVRKKSGSGFIRAEESVTFPKQRRIETAIKLFLLKYEGNAKNLRIDLIAFQDEALRHYPNFIV
jgi:putative endonuclease